MMPDDYSDRYAMRMVTILAKDVSQEVDGNFSVEKGKKLRKCLKDLIKYLEKTQINPQHPGMRKLN